MDPNQANDRLHVTRDKWTRYDYTVTKQDEPNTGMVTLKLRQRRDEGSIIVSGSHRTLYVEHEYQEPRTWTVHEAVSTGLFLGFSGVHALVRRPSRARPYYIIEANSCEYILRTLGVNRGDRQVRLVPDGTELTSRKSDTIGEVVGEIKFDSVGKRLYSVTFQSDLPLETQALCIWIAIVQGRKDDTVVKAATGFPRHRWVI